MVSFVNYWNYPTPIEEKPIPTPTKNMKDSRLSKLSIIRESPTLERGTEVPTDDTVYNPTIAPKRETWSSKVDFILSCVGFAVGLGNVWRFPYKCYKNGGGAFLIPYIICLAVAGLPLMFMELSFGQFSSLGPISVWKISPLFKGLGYAMIIVIVLVAIYYNIVITYILHYLFASFTSTLPWTHCGNHWNTINCFDNKTEENITSSAMNITDTHKNISSNISNIEYVSPTREYWERRVLQLSSGIDDLGGCQWELSLILLLSWVIIFLCLIKGIKSSGKVVYFTALFPYVILLTFLIRGAMLPGAATGVLYFITPDMNRLADPMVWMDAALQIFYSLGPGCGALLTMGSYNKFKNNCLKDAITVSIMNCCTSILCGFVVFCVLGFMSHRLGVSIDKVEAGGPGLAFITFSEAIAQMPGAPFWAVMFFLMLLTVGLDTQFVAVEIVVSGLSDEFPRYLRRYKLIFTAALCVLFCLLGLPMTTRGGNYLLHLVDSYSAGYVLLVVAFLECIVLNWIYGYDRFARDIELMIGHKPNIYWRACWQFVSPALILAIFLFSLIMYRPLTYGSYVYPAWSNGLGWCFALVSIIMIPIFALKELSRHVDVRKEEFCSHIDVRKIFHESISPRADWGPAEDDNRRMWRSNDAYRSVPSSPAENPENNQDTPAVIKITNL